MFVSCLFVVGVSGALLASVVLLWWSSDVEFAALAVAVNANKHSIEHIQQHADEEHNRVRREVLEVRKILELQTGKKVTETHSTTNEHTTRT